MWEEGPGDFLAVRPTENCRTALRSRALHPTTLSSPAGWPRPAVAKAGPASPEPRHRVPPCPTGNTTSGPSCLPRTGPRHCKRGVGKEQGCGTAWALRGWPGHSVVAKAALLDRALWACSAALAMWDAMLSQPHTLEKVLRELLSKPQDQRLRRMFSSHTEDACIHHLAVSDQTSPCSPSGLCLPLQQNRHGPLPSHLPPSGHLLALGCQWEPGAARCGEPCRLCQSLMGVFVSAAGLQRHQLRGVCWPLQSPEVPEAAKPGAVLAGAQGPHHAVAET